MDLHVDLGQVIIATLITAIGYLIKSEVSHFRTRLDKHDSMLINLVADVQKLIGIVTVKHDTSGIEWNGFDRRNQN